MVKSGGGKHKRVPDAPTAYRFDLPYGAVAPRLVNAELGLHNVVARVGHNAAYSMDITLLDAPDHRLVRSGVLLAHRVVDGRGEWYLGAPDWQPLLPEERVEPMGQAELPDSFVDLLAPFRRRAPLGPVAGITCDRSEFAVRDDRGHTLALLRDDRVTVRRGGLTTARYREVLLTSLGPGGDTGLSADQVSYVRAALTASGATPVARFPRLASRLGAPATGPTDFPEPATVDGTATLESFVSALLAGRQQELLRADLAVRGPEPSGGAEPDAASRLGAVARTLRDDLQALAAVLQPRWSEDLVEELDWLVEQADGEPTALPARLRGERYLTLLERLVTATRAPQLGDSATLDSAEVVQELLAEAVTTLAEVADSVRVDSPSARWEDFTAAAADLARTAEVAARIDPDRAERVARRLAPLRVDLADVSQRSARLEEIAHGATLGSAADAFEAGRGYEREVLRLDAEKELCCERWPATSAKLRAALVGKQPDAKAKRKKRR